MAHILVIDDEAAVRTLMRRILERAGHSVSEAENGVEGTERFDSARPALVVTDLLMPKESGLKTIGRIRELDAGVPILAISGGGRNGRMNFLSTARTFPGVRSLEKPFGAHELTSTIDEMLGSTAQKNRDGDGALGPSAPPGQRP